MEFKFEGATDGLSEVHLKFISKVLRKEGVQDATVNIEAVGKAGDNYGSLMKRVITNKNGENFKMVAKVKPIVNKGDSADLLKTAFENEYLMYTETLPKYVELEREANIPESEKLFLPVIYGVFMEEPNAIFLMEDLRQKCYAIYDRFKSLPDEAVKLVIKYLASLHAYSFVLKDKRPAEYKAIASKLNNLWIGMTEAEDIKKMFPSVENDILQALEGEEYQKYFKNTVTNMKEIFDEATKSEKDSNYSVITHGDSWTNNIMFRTEGDKISACCLVDYQVSSIASPLWDLNLLIFSTTDYDTRRKYYHEWIEFYYTELTRKLSYFDLKSEVVYSRDQYKKDIQRYAKFCFAQTAFASVTLVKDSKDIAVAKAKEQTENKDFMDTVFETTKLSTSSDATLEKFRAKVKGLVDSFIDLGYL